MGLISNGTTIFDNGAMSTGAGSMTLVSSATASSSASIEFSLGSYKEYKFFFVNIHPSVDNSNFQFQCSIDGGSNYGVTITSTVFLASLYENDTNAEISYNGSNDLAQSTSYQRLTDVGSDNDQACSGTLSIFNPSSTTYVKHFIGNMNTAHASSASFERFIAGYFNDTNDLTNIKFQMSSGNIDEGKILMFGIN